MGPGDAVLGVFDQHGPDVVFRGGADFGVGGEGDLAAVDAVDEVTDVVGLEGTEAIEEFVEDDSN